MKNKGITLVALVVTIVIMLILAGVTLNIALGDNGLFKMTRQAVNRYKTAQGDEEEAMQDLSDEIYGLIGKGKDDETTGKMTTQAFVDLLNGEREEESWKMGKEYPILSWQ